MKRKKAQMEKELLSSIVPVPEQKAKNNKKGPEKKVKEEEEGPGKKKKKKKAKKTKNPDGPPEPPGDPSPLQSLLGGPLDFLRVRPASLVDVLSSCLILFWP